MRQILVSGADKSFYPFLVDLLDSLHLIGVTHRYDVGVLDFGLSGDQAHALHDRGVLVRPPQRGVEIARRRVRMNPATMATIGKLTLPEQFPGYDVYIWSDADIWFQEPDGLAWLSEAARTGAMAVVPELDRCYCVPDPAGVLKWRLDRMRIAVGWRLARKLIHFPYMNGGLFALSSDAPHWKEWQVGYGKAIGSGRFTGGIAQGYLIKMLFQDGLPHVPLPASCNWMCHLAEPLWDEDRRKFVEPFSPHSVIQGIHLTSRTKNDARFRFDRERYHFPRTSRQS